MAESTLTLTYAQLRRAFGRLLGWDPDPANWSALQIADGESILASGLRQFYAPPPIRDQPSHRWSFLTQRSSIEMVAMYSTGTVAIVNGVATLTGGTYPAWTAAGEVSVGGTAYTVATRDGNNQATLDDLTVNVDAGTTFKLFQVAFEMPANFAGAIDGPMTYRPYSCQADVVEITNDMQLRQKRQNYECFRRPDLAAISILPDASATRSTRFRLEFWPIPDAAYVIEYSYMVLTEIIDGANVYPLGGMQHAETIQESVLAAAEEKSNDNSGLHMQKFLMRLAASVDADRRIGPERLGRMYDPSMNCGNTRQFGVLPRRTSGGPTRYIQG